MKNNVEGGNYLRGQEGSVKGWLVAALFGGVALAAIVSQKEGMEMDRIAGEFVPPQGATEVLPPASKHSLIRVYEGQSKPNCPGGIQELVNLIDRNGNFRGDKVVCNPVPAEPVK